MAPVLRAAGRLDHCLELAPPGAAERAALLAGRLRERGASCAEDDIQVRGLKYCLKDYCIHSD